MAKPPYIIPRDLADLPHLMAAGYVMSLAGYGRATLKARIAAGLMPARAGRGRDGDMFNRDAVLASLGLAVPVQKKAETQPGLEWMLSDEQVDELRLGSGRNAGTPKT